MCQKTKKQKCPRNSKPAVNGSVSGDPGLKNDTKCESGKQEKVVNNEG